MWRQAGRFYSLSYFTYLFVQNILHANYIGIVSKEIDQRAPTNCIRFFDSIVVQKMHKFDEDLSSECGDIRLQNKKIRNNTLLQNIRPLTSRSLTNL